MTEDLKVTPPETVKLKLLLNHKKLSLKRKKFKFK